MADTDDRKIKKVSRYYKKQTVDKNVYEMAKERVAHCFDIFDTIVVMFSGGKDSTAVLNVALDTRRERGIEKPLDVVFFDEEAIPTEVIDYVERVANLPDVRMRWMAVPHKHRNACSLESPYWYPWAPEKRDLWVRPMPTHPSVETTIDGYNPEDKINRISIPALAPALYPPDQYGRVGAMLGIRADESLRRTNIVSRRKKENYIVKQNSDPFGGRALHFDNFWKVYPIYDWRTSDVWLAPNRLGWDYCRAYDKMEMAGVSHSMQRVAPPFGEQPIQRLWTYAKCFPDIWDKMTRRVPGANTAALYSRTELYAYKDKPSPREGQSWQELIRELIQRHNPEIGRWVANRIHNDITRHYRETTRPIQDYDPDPVTGVSWEWLAFLAQYGDTKGRRDTRVQRKKSTRFEE